MKITFNTLKKYARKNQLVHSVNSEFNGMIDGHDSTNYPTKAKHTTLEDLKKFKVSKNWISAPDIHISTCGTRMYRKVLLSNCCYVVSFTMIDKYND